LGLITKQTKGLPMVAKLESSKKLIKKEKETALNEYNKHNKLQDNRKF
jgi:hypothetical protein